MYLYKSHSLVAYIYTYTYFCRDTETLFAIVKIAKTRRSLCTRTIYYCAQFLYITLTLYLFYVTHMAYSECYNVCIKIATDAQYIYPLVCPLTVFRPYVLVEFCKYWNVMTRHCVYTCGCVGVYMLVPKALCVMRLKVALFRKRILCVLILIHDDDTHSNMQSSSN